MIWRVYRNERRTSGDVLIAGLCSACVWMSVTCGTQCLASAISQCFYGGNLACSLEAYFHVSAIVAQFLHTTAIAFRAWRMVVKQQHMTCQQALRTIAIIWTVSILGTLIAALFSPIYLMTAGKFLFLLSFDAFE